MKKKFAALGLCTIYLLILIECGGFVGSGNFGRLVDGEPLDWGKMGVLFKLPKVWRGSAIFLFSLIFWDAYTLLIRRFENAGLVGSPADDPLGYAWFLLRRYTLIPVSLVVVAIIGYFLPTDAGGLATIVFLASIVLARRPFNTTYGNFGLAVCKLIFGSYYLDKFNPWRKKSR